MHPRLLPLLLLLLAATSAPGADGPVLCEAEEFRPEAPGGWQAKPWGTNYYAATFANSFLSRKAYLGAPERGPRTVATHEAAVPVAGRYLALVRYEAAPGFETQFRLQVEQNGQQRLDRLYGARDNLKIWAFREGLKKEVRWPWGAVENVVWEGHDAFVELAAGPARLRLVADDQPGDAARRNVDLVLLTRDAADVQQRLAKENYLPLDGLLTQVGDLFLRVHNAGAEPLTLTVPNGTEHSPYWVHQRSWKPKTITAAPGAASDWVEVGGLLDTLNDGQWKLSAKAKGAVRYALQFGVPGAGGTVTPRERFDDLTGDVELAYPADVRRGGKVRRVEEVLYELVDYLKKQPSVGTPPKRTLVYGYTFPARPVDARYTAALAEFLRLMGTTAVGRDEVERQEGDGPARGYIDVRSIPTDKLEAHCRQLQTQGKAERIAVVSLGDEIGLAAPPAGAHAEFRQWLQGRGLKPSEVDPAAGADWEKIRYSPAPATAKTSPGLYYHSRLYAFRHGIAQLKTRTDILRRHLPNAHVGANFSPHHGAPYLGDTYHWISVFREGGMTMPWGEDYIWQVPVGTQQMNGLVLDMFRAGVRGRPGARIQFYVMPHWPGNTPNGWRRQFYTALGHGANVLNLFEFRPVQAAYTENHVSLPEMYQEVRRGLHELGRFEDVVQDGGVRPADVGLWFSEAADVWNDNVSPFDAGKRTLYTAICHAGLPLDVVVEGDELKRYRVLYLTDRHVSRAASRALADWVGAGGRLFATAGAGLLDEFDAPNAVLRELFGVEPRGLDESKTPLRREKEDLPFAEPLGMARAEGGGSIPVFGVRSRFTARGAEVLRTFDGGEPALVRKQTGSGAAWYCGFLPGLSYFHPAIPRRPVDRGATDDSMAHFIPTRFDAASAGVVRLPATGLVASVTASEPLVEAMLLETQERAVVTLVNWSAGPVRGLVVTLGADVPGRTVALASGRPVRLEMKEGKRVCTLDLDVADALVLQ